MLCESVAIHTPKDSQILSYFGMCIDFNSFAIVKSTSRTSTRTQKLLEWGTLIELSLQSSKKETVTALGLLTHFVQNITD